jgi:hypothetical protein
MSADQQKRIGKNCKSYLSLFMPRQLELAQRMGTLKILAHGQMVRASKLQSRKAGRLVVARAFQRRGSGANEFRPAVRDGWQSAGF